MTYSELLTALSELDEEQLDLNVTVSVDDEFYEAKDLHVQEKDDVIRDGHPFLEII
tara:strand:+ start:462 stop:629 length:168 start_codon:yes stop_codon:yes gene_type:complete